MLRLPNHPLPLNSKPKRVVKKERATLGSSLLERFTGPRDYFFSSMPFVAPPFFFMRQQETSSLPHSLHEWTRMFLASWPWPWVTILLSHLSQRWMGTFFISPALSPFRDLSTT